MKRKEITNFQTEIALFHTIETFLSRSILSFFVELKNSNHFASFPQLLENIITINNITNTKKLTRLEFLGSVSIEVPPSIKYLINLTTIKFVGFLNIQLPREIGLLKINTLEFNQCHEIQLEKDTDFAYLNQIEFKYHNKAFPLWINAQIMPKLQQLSFLFSKAKSIPSYIFQMPLEYIDLSYNKIQYFGLDISINPSIKRIDLSHNELVSFPFALNPNPDLSIYLKDNQLLYLPKDILSHLRRLIFDESSLDAEIREQIQVKFEEGIDSNGDFKERLATYYYQNTSNQNTITTDNEFFIIFCTYQLDCEIWVKLMENYLNVYEGTDITGLLTTCFKRHPLRNKYVSYFIDKYQISKKINEFFTEHHATIALNNYKILL